MRFITATELSRNPERVLDSLDDREINVLTRYGKPIAVVFDVSDDDKYKEALAIAEYVKAMRQAREAKCAA